jgi:recyclin-1
MGPTRFLASQNPALVKRNVLASFTNLLLLPVTIVPRTVGVVGEALITGGSAAVQGISMLNPQRWGPGGVTNGRNSYSTNLEKDGQTVFEADEDDEEEVKRKFDIGSPTPLMTPSNNIATPLTSNDSNVQHQLDLLLSLDVALEIIHADRESLKRVETFAGYPGHYGHRVHDTIEEIFILMLQTMGEKHIAKGFAMLVRSDLSIDSLQLLICSS